MIYENKSIYIKIIQASRFDFRFSSFSCVIVLDTSMHDFSRLVMGDGFYLYRLAVTYQAKKPPPVSRQQEGWGLLVTFDVFINQHTSDE